MSKRGSLKHQIVKDMEKRQCYGVSKKEAQLRERDRCRAEGIPWNPARVGEKIYSVTTYDSYINSAVKFGEFIKEKHEINKIELLKDKGMEYAKEYLDYYINSGKSPDAIHTVASGVAKFLDTSYTKFDIEMPARGKSITRSRLERAHDKEFSREKHADLIKFGEGTGLRKEELSLVRPEQIFERDGRVYIEFVKEKYGPQTKGARDRTEVIRKGYEKTVLESRNKAISEGRDRVFEKVPNRLDEHALRREYAQGLYKELEQEKHDRGEQTKEYYRLRNGSGRKYDKEILREVSHNLGHGDDRCHTIVHHYIE